MKKKDITGAIKEEESKATEMKEVKDEDFFLKEILEALNKKRCKETRIAVENIILSRQMEYYKATDDTRVEKFKENICGMAKAMEDKRCLSSCKTFVRHINFVIGYFFEEA